MADLSTNYMGLKLRNPVIAGSSGLTETLPNLQDLEKNGAAAVILKSLFEEEILHELNERKRQMTKPAPLYPEVYDAFDDIDMEDSTSNYLFLIEAAKKSLSIPVIPSINAVTAEEWPSFAKQFESAGADAIELNAFILPSDLDRPAGDMEKVYFDIVEKVKKEVSIPVALKISFYFTNLATMIKKLSETGIGGLVLFNRFYSPDFNLDNFSVMSSNVLSTPGEFALPLRWISIMSGRVGCDLCASTGIHSGRAVIKQILAGAKAVQVTSTLYRHGNGRLQYILDEVETWMDEHGYKSLDEFRGRMSQEKSKNPAAYERVQFMKYFAGK